ncbi:MAG: GNAT family N-acetyltransferase [Candidatus Nanopelagicales bacterium]
MRIERGYPPADAPTIAGLFLSGFGAKLHNVTGTDDRARDFFAAELDPGTTLVARVDQRAVAALGYLVAGTGHPLRQTWANAWRSYRLSAVWRVALLALLDQKATHDALHIDWLCVDPQTRGTGAGTALVFAAQELAAEQGKTALTLSVVDSNSRAKALYERLGFVTVATQRLPAPRRLFGFGSADEMRKDFG